MWEEPVLVLEEILKTLKQQDFLHLLSMQLRILNFCLQLQLHYQDGLNNQISPQFIYETNQHTVNDLFLRKIAGSSDTFTIAEQNQLYAIAAQCPFAGGDAVFQARSLYTLVDPDISWSNEVACSPPLPLAQPTSEEPLFRLYPNPTQDYLLIEQEKGDLDQNFGVILRNALGKIVLQTSIQTNPGVFYAKGLPSGIYTVSILEKGIRLQTSKILLIE